MKKYTAIVHGDDQDLGETYIVHIEAKDISEAKRVAEEAAKKMAGLFGAKYFEAMAIYSGWLEQATE